MCTDSRKTQTLPSINGLIGRARGGGAEWGHSHVQQVLDSTEARGGGVIQAEGKRRVLGDPGGLPQGSASVTRPCGRRYSNPGRGDSMQPGRKSARDLVGMVGIRVRYQKKRPA